jgi:hypothetical protein
MDAAIGEVGAVCTRCTTDRPRRAAARRISDTRVRCVLAVTRHDRPLSVAHDMAARPVQHRAGVRTAAPREDIVLPEHAPPRDAGRTIPRGVSNRLAALRRRITTSISWERIPWVETTKSRHRCLDESIRLTGGDPRETRRSPCTSGRDSLFVG